MLDTTNGDPFIFLHRNKKEFRWGKSGDLERLYYGDKIINHHPAHFNITGQAYYPQIKVIHFEALKNRASRIKKYLKRAKLKKTRPYGMTDDMVIAFVDKLETAPVCRIEKHNPKGLRFYNEFKVKPKEELTHDESLLKGE